MSLTPLPPDAACLSHFELAGLDRRGFAWEIVRRMTQYRGLLVGARTIETLRGGANPILMIEQPASAPIGGLLFRRALQPIGG